MDQAHSLAPHHQPRVEISGGLLTSLDLGHSFEPNQRLDEADKGETTQVGSCWLLWSAEYANASVADGLRDRVCRAVGKLNEAAIDIRSATDVNRHLAARRSCHCQCLEDSVQTLYVPRG